ncbi:MAG: molybdopterin-guanine dinucleotide biosynthesis protein B [Candidatus Thermoplasmatota archaeon]|nr:molybdopterin-guanine dinucleotide biosynthesis protein B [Candidatus Thermoplasmatota archaeon]
MIIGIYGYQDAGKTKLVEQLVRALVKKGYRVSSIKHTPYDKTIDCEGKDTWRHWKAGSDPVVFSSETETTMIKHSKTSADNIARMILAEFRPDVLIIEGFKEGSFPKVAIGQITPRKGTVLTNPMLADLVKYIEGEVAVERIKEHLPGLDCVKCGLDCDGLARAIVAGKKKRKDCKELSDIGVQILVDGRRIVAGKFVSSIVDDTVRGMLSSLKGYRPGKVVEIRLEPKKQNAKSRSPRK